LDANWARCQIGWARAETKPVLDNARVVRYLSQHCAEILAEFQKIVETKSLTMGE
jgi:hypothetical protein